jgi:hypothetical protein
MLNNNTEVKPTFSEMLGADHQHALAGLPLVTVIDIGQSCQGLIHVIETAAARLQGDTEMLAMADQAWTISKEKQ